MALRAIGTVPLPPHRAPGGFDHASVHRGADRLYVAHTINDAVEVIDLERRVHEATLPGFPGVAGAAVCEERRLLVATCKKEGTVGLAALDDPATIRRIPVTARPNGLALASRAGIALAACIGDPGVPALAVIDLDRGAMVTVESASGRVVAQVPIAGSPDVVFYNPRRDRLYVAIGDPGVLQSIDVNAGRVVETVTTGKGAKTFGFDANREHVFAFLPAFHAAAVFAEG